MLSRISSRAEINVTPSWPEEKRLKAAPVLVARSNSKRGDRFKKTCPSGICRTACLMTWSMPVKTADITKKTTFFIELWIYRLLSTMRTSSARNLPIIGRLANAMLCNTYKSKAPSTVKPMENPTPLAAPLAKSASRRRFHTERGGRRFSISSSCMEIRSSGSSSSDKEHTPFFQLSMTKARRTIPLKYRKSRVIPCLAEFYSRRLICSMEAVCASVIFLREL